MVKIYLEEKEKKSSARKDVAITLRGNSMVVVDPNNGEHIAYLVEFTANAPYYSTGAKEELDDDNYRTDFAEWNKDGAVFRFIEDFE